MWHTSFTMNLTPTSSRKKSSMKIHLWSSTNSVRTPAAVFRILRFSVLGHFFCSVIITLPARKRCEKKALTERVVIVCGRRGTIITSLFSWFFFFELQNRKSKKKDQEWRTRRNSQDKRFLEVFLTFFFFFCKEGRKRKLESNSKWIKLKIKRK